LVLGFLASWSAEVHLGTPDLLPRFRPGLHDGELFGHFGGALEKAGVDVKYVSRVSLAARRAAEKERELPVRDRLLREVVVNAQCVVSRVAKLLGHGDA